MGTNWISLRKEWRLQDVQAALNVVISGLSALGIFALTRFCWQASARQSFRHEYIPVSALLTVSTFGEVWDTIWLLKDKIILRRHAKVLAQVVIVSLLSATTLFSGPIAKFSTRLANATEDVLGFIATRSHASISEAHLRWNSTFASLDRASFPYDRLLDYVPDTSINWLYVPDQWNSSWVLGCTSTESTPVVLVAGDSCTDLYAEMPALENIISKDGQTRYKMGGYYVNDTWTHGLLTLAKIQVTDFDESTSITYGMFVEIAAVYLHSIPRQMNTSSSCDFGKGPAKSASFTKVACNLTRTAHDPELSNIAFPDSVLADQVADAMYSYYQDGVVASAIRNTSVPEIPPRDIIRFYQTWLITKDTQNLYSVRRRLDVQASIVQLSTAFLAVAIFTLILITFGIVVYIIARLANKRTLANTPQSKLEWMLKLIHATTPESPPECSLPSIIQSTYSPTPKEENDLFIFENARYTTKSLPFVRLPLRSTQSHDISFDANLTSNPPLVEFKKN